MATKQWTLEVRGWPWVVAGLITAPVAAIVIFWALILVTRTGAAKEGFGLLVTLVLLGFPSCFLLETIVVSLIYLVRSAKLRAVINGHYAGLGLLVGSIVGLLATDTWFNLAFWVFPPAGLKFSPRGLLFLESGLTSGLFGVIVAVIFRMIAIRRVKLILETAHPRDAVTRMAEYGR